MNYQEYQELIARHEMHMGLSTMDMGMSASSTMDMGMAASSTMDMGASSTMDMSSASSTMDMSSMDHSMGSMHMFFTTQYDDYPVLFKDLRANNAGQAFGIFLLLFVVAFLVRGIEFTRNYLEQVVWKNPSYVDCHPGQAEVTPKAANCCSGDETDESTAKVDTRINEVEGAHANARPSWLPLASRLVRNAIRLALCILPDLFGFALMLAAMTYTLTYFFAVVLGLGIGRFFFERLSDRHNLKPVGANGAFHCS